jgi:HD-GYP domain-containing protein (c-di-GMP phosphodiesterase class II)
MESSPILTCTRYRRSPTKKNVAPIYPGWFVHDLGTIGVPHTNLNKTPRLTVEAYEVIRTHPEPGEQVLSDHLLAPLSRDTILCHHERPDGKGYSHGLKSDAICIDARIMGIADGFDAMTSTRPYRRGMTVENALW